MGKKKFENSKEIIWFSEEDSVPLLLLTTHKNNTHMENLKEKDKVLFVAFFYNSGYSNKPLFETFDKVYEVAELFVNSYPEDRIWGADEGGEDFEEYMEKYIKKYLDI